VFILITIDIRLLDTKLQNAYRIIAAKKLKKKIFNSDNSHNFSYKISSI